jgi:hypothetical protein
MNMKKASFMQRINHLQKVHLKKFLIKRKQYMKNLVIVSFPAKTETLDHQTEYLSWRIETGLLELLEPLLEGGAASLKATICGPEHTDI